MNVCQCEIWRDECWGRAFVAVYTNSIYIHMYECVHRFHQVVKPAFPSAIRYGYVLFVHEVVQYHDMVSFAAVCGCCVQCSRAYMHTHTQTRWRCYSTWRSQTNTIHACGCMCVYMYMYVDTLLNDSFTAHHHPQTAHRSTPQPFAGAAAELS